MLDTLLQVAGRAHPLLLHLPIGMLVALIALEVLALARLLELTPRIRAVLAWLIFLSAAASIATGLLLEREPAYTGGDTLNLHKWTGIGFGILALFAALSLSLPRLRKAYPLLLLLAAASLFPAGHLGASMTHGEGFLTEPLTARSARGNDSARGSPAINPVGGGAYAARIAPLLDRYCISCHGESKQKGKLALHTPEAILAGGSTGSAIEPGDPENSEIIYRLRLPHGDRDRMPPKDKPQPSDDEILAIEAWIADGASFGDSTAAQLADAASAPRARDTEPAPSEEPKRTTAPPPPEAIDAIRAHQAHIETIDPQAGFLWAAFDAAPDTTDADVERLLSPLADHIAELSLAGTRITDTSLRLIAAMPNLRRLSLARTACTSAGIAHLAALRHLEELNLTGASLDDAAAENLGFPDRFPALASVYLWKSGISDDAISALRAARPSLRLTAAAPPAEPLETEPAIVFSGDAPPPGSPAPPAPAPGSAAAATDALRPVNDLCPVAGKPIDARFALVHQGRVVAFCCQKCLSDFLANPGGYAISPRRD